MLRGEHWTAFVPFAARWPLEVHMLPHRHVPDFAATTRRGTRRVRPAVPRLLRGVDALYDTPTPYIAAWHQAPVHVRRDDVRLHAAADLAAPRRRTSSSTWPGPRRRWARGSRDIPPEAAAARLEEGHRHAHERLPRDERCAKERLLHPSFRRSAGRTASGRRPAAST